MTANRVLEYDKIIHSLKELAGSEMTKEFISGLRPFHDARLIEDGLAETDEALALILHKGALPLGNFYDCSDEIGRAQKGASLSMAELLHIMRDIRIVTDVKNFMKSDVPELPIHEAIMEVMAGHKNLGDEIDRCIYSEDEMNDHASAELASLRRRIAAQNDAIRARLNAIINARSNQETLQDAIITVRDGRYVVPVKTEHRAKVPGIVHDRSASGATQFIEPQQIVDLNNELKELEIEERAEIDRILAELSERVGENARTLLNDQKLLVQLDFITAKGKLAKNMKAERPLVTDDGILELKKACHPLLDHDTAVPTDIVLGEDYRALVITGPNTGGKTVALKTAGLLSLMAHTGLFVPAASGSKIPLLDAVYADIGDEQSIEQSLSTFSSHMMNIVKITEGTGPKTLVLLDELGAGTDPAEGAALAIAVLEDLMNKGALIMATTHYAELKKYAIEAENVENGSMGFDIDTLTPTYHLTIGLPGKSNAFDISQKLGLPEDIIEKARSLLDGGDAALEDILTAIEAEKKAAEAEREEAIAMNIEIKRRSEEMAREREVFEEKKEKALADAREEARRIIADARAVSEEVKEDLKELSKIESMGERNRRFDEDRKKLKDAAGRYRETFIRETNDDPISIDEVKIGDRVKVLTIGQNGTILALPDERGMLQVEIGSMKMRVKPDDLKLIREGERRKRKPVSRVNYGSMYKAKAQNVRTEVDVRGQNLDEALENVLKYLDDAMVAGLDKVRIIHGRGEGILSKGIRDALRENKSVDSYSRGRYDEGGDGVTVVSFKR